MNTVESGRFFRKSRFPTGIVITLTPADLRSAIDAEVIGLQLGETVEKDRPATLIIDFSSVRVFSSALVSTMLSVRSRLQRYGGELVLCGLSLSLEEVLAVMNINQLIRVFGTVEEALSSTEPATRGPHERYGKMPRSR